MARKPVSVRFTSEGAERVVADAKRIGDGDAHLRRLAGAAKPASAGLRAVDEAAREARNAITGLGSGVPVLGRLATALGPVGLAVTALTGGYLALGRAGSTAAAQIAAVGDAADRLQVDPGLFERLGAAITLSGQSATGLEAALRTLNTRLGEAARGGTEAQRILGQLGVRATDSEGRMRGLDAIIADVADGFAAIPDPAVRAEAATKLFGEQGGALLTILAQGREGFESLTAEAERLGMLYGGDLIRESQRITAELNAQEQVISARLNVALAPFARLWLDVREAVAATLGPLGQMLDVLQRIFGLTSGGGNIDQLRERLAEVTREIALREQGVEPSTAERRRASRTGAGARPLVGRTDEQLAATRAELEAAIARLTPPEPVSLPPIDPVTPPGGRAPQREDPFEGIVRDFRARDRDLGLQRRLTLIDGEEERRQLEIAEQALNRLEDAYAQIARAAEQPPQQITPEQIETIREWSGALAEAQTQVAALQRAQREHEEQAERSKATMDALSSSFGDWTRQIIDSDKPMRTFLSLLAQFAAQTLTGGGPLGGAINQALGVTAGGVFSAAFGINAAQPAAAPGSAFGRSFTVPGAGGHDSRMMRMPVTPGERVSVEPRRPGEALAGARRTTRLPQPSAGRVGFELSRAGTAAEMASFINRARRLS